MSGIIEVDQLCFDYPGRRALESVSFSIPRGSVTALVGPNGAGKTTLLRCLAALFTPYSGRVRVGGIDTTEDPRAVHRQMGYLSDFFGLYDSLRVEQCLIHAAQMRGVPEGRLAEAVAAVLERLNLTDRAGMRARELSRGLRQRLAIAQAIVHQPAIALLDEPASGLDPEARAELSVLINRLRSEGMTLIVSSHILSELEAYSSHMLIIDNGRVSATRALDEGAGESCRVVRLRLLPGSDGAGQNLYAEAGVEALEQEGETLRFTFRGDDAALHSVLAHLIRDGVPVVEFAIDRLRMEQVYLQDLDSARASQLHGGNRIEGVECES